jgi:hypothetical protein
MFQCLPFVNCHMVGLFTLDDVLGLVSLGKMHIAFEPHGRNNFLDDYATNSATRSLIIYVSSLSIQPPKMSDHA